MKYTLVFVLALFVIGCSEKVPPQCDYVRGYYPLIYQADYQFETKNFEEAFLLYEKAFAHCKPLNTPLYNEISKFSKASAILKKDAVTARFLEERIQHGTELAALERDTVYAAFFETELGAGIKAKYPELREAYEASLDLGLRKEIQKMRDLDQKFRLVPEPDESQIDSIDTVNEIRIKEIFETIGYPNDQVIGGFKVDRIPTNIDIMLLHTFDSPNREYFLKKVEGFIQNGTCPPMMLGTMIDLYHLKYNRPQVYGTYTKPNGELSNAIDLDSVDKNRLSIGLPTLKQKRQKDSLDAIKYGY
ncbi:hypothetical protein ABV409_14470 [Flagellimonas sp. DF-77]|uniref:hypothetical protein n=1 Tax=Flagellimonas algarum TaxID=3230298 RepID=UPI003398C9DE